MPNCKLQWNLRRLSQLFSLSLSLFLLSLVLSSTLSSPSPFCPYILIYMHTHTHTHTHIYIYISTANSFLKLVSWLASEWVENSFWLNWEVFLKGFCFCLLPSLFSWFSKTQLGWKVFSSLPAPHTMKVSTVATY